MIAGLSSSGIATAIRTAGEARARADRAGQEIATGRRVASARDDGAAFARAAGMRSDLVGTRALRTNLAMLNSVFEVNAAATEARMEMIEPLSHNALAATDPSLSAQARAALQAFQSVPPAAAATIGAQTHDFYSTSGARFTFNNLDSDNQILVLADQSGATRSYQGSGLASFPTGSTTDLSTPATAATARQLIEDSLAVQRSRLAYWGSVGNALDRFDGHLGRSEDRIAAAIGSLTDADLGKASAARAQAETRQQLALQTVRRALDAYGAFAGGLLANAQRTQRALA